MKKPIFLLADSQLLFWNEGNNLFIKRITNLLEENGEKKPFSAAYIGASNNDTYVFYELFVAAMQQIGIINTKFIESNPTIESLDFIKSANIILLAGGSIALGWQTFLKTKLYNAIIEAYFTGKIIIGVSAGAVLLGRVGWNDIKGNFDERTTTDLSPVFKTSDKEITIEDVFSTFQLVPYIIDVHDDPLWDRLYSIFNFVNSPRSPLKTILSEGLSMAIGIPSGGGAIFYPDCSIEPIRRALIELKWDPSKKETCSNLIITNRI